MHPISDRMAAELRGSHRVAVRAEVLDGGQPVLELAVVDGYVSIDGSAAHRRSCDVTLEDPDGRLVPADGRHPLAPYGNELRLSRGVVYPAGEHVGLLANAATWGDGHIGEGLIVDVFAPDGALILARRDS